MMEWASGAASWATSTGPPNWVFLVAVLTTPSRWTNIVMTRLQQRLGGE